MSSQALPRIAYVISEYPAVAHTFIEREVVGLRKLGLDIRTVSMQAPDSEAPRSSVDREELKTTWSLHPLTTARSIRAWASALRHPKALAAAIKSALSDTAWTPNRVVLQLRYIPEALILWDWAKRNDIHHLHAHFANNANEVSRLAVHFANAIEPHSWKFTFTMHGPTAFFDVTQHGIAQKVEAADAVACITHFTKSQLLSIGPRIDWDKLRVCHLGTDFIEDLPSRPTKARRILCIGRLVDKKGQAVLIRAVSALHNQGYELSCRIVGEGPLHTELQALVRELDLESVVTLTGALQQEDVARELREADIFCMPSFSEGLPVSVMEAMSWGLPVITSNIAGVPELITDGLDGLLVLPSDEVSLTLALVQLIDDEDLRMQIATNGQKRIDEYFNVQMAAERMKAFFEYCYSLER